MSQTSSTLSAPLSPAAPSNTLAINGGEKAVASFEAKAEPKLGKVEFLAIAKRYGFKDDALKRLDDTITDDNLQGAGPNLGKYATTFPKPSSGSQFEKTARDLFGSPFALGISSGTGALHAAFVACGAKPGAQVIVPAVGFMATAAAAAITGATPVFCDIDDSLQMDPTKLEECITDKTVAVAPTHHWGGVADMDPIMEIAGKHNIKVIEDCAQSPGAKYKGKYVGTIGDFGCFSISAYKIIGGGEGGLILAHDQKLFDAAQQLAECGGLWREDRFAPPRYEGELFVGTNYRMSELEAAVDNVQLQKLPDIVKRFRAAFERITAQLLQVENVKPAKVNDRAGAIGYQLWLIPQSFELGDRVVAALRAEGISAGMRGAKARPDWHRCKDMFPLASVLTDESRQDQCPVGDDLHNRRITIGINQWWTENDCDNVAKGINKVLKAYGTT